jgi:rhodanese-related sulfurtransferase
MVRGFLTALCALTFSISPAVGDEEHTPDSLDTVKQSLTDKKAVLVDVREKKEWDARHLEGALHAPLSELKTAAGAKRFVERLPEKKVVYTHCAAGVRSVAAAKILREHGIDVRPLKPGYDDLLDAGFKKADAAGKQ